MRNNKKIKIVYLTPEIQKNTGGYFRIKDNLEFLRTHFEIEEIWIKSRRNFNNLIEYIIYLNKLRRKLKNKIIFMEFSKYIFLVPFSSKLIYSAHNFETSLRFSFFLTRRDFKSFIEFLVWSISEFIVLFRANIIITITDTLSEQLKKFTWKKIYTLFPKVKEIFYSKIDYKNLENSYYFVGSFDWLPNYEAYQYFIKTLLPFFSQKYNKSIKFYFIGKGNEKFEDFKINNVEIIHFGFIDDLEDVISKCKGSILPIISGSGLKIKLLENIMYSKISITTLKAIEGLENYKENFLLFDNIETFCENIKFLDIEDNYINYKKKTKYLLKELINTRNKQEDIFIKKVYEI